MSTLTNGFETAPPTVWVLTCQSFDNRPYPPECVSEEWMPSHQLPGTVSFVDLNTADAWQIAAAIGALWACAWVVRLLRKSFEARVSI